jgi:hypothetical protein
MLLKCAFKTSPKMQFSVVHQEAFVVETSMGGREEQRPCGPGEVQKLPTSES